MAEPDGSFRLLGNSAWNAAAFVIRCWLEPGDPAVRRLPSGPRRIRRCRPGDSLPGARSGIQQCLALSTARELAHRLAPADRDDARRFFATALLLAVGIGGLIVIGLAWPGRPLARLAFHLGGDSANDLGRAFALGAVGWLCQCVSAVFLALFTARQIIGGFPRSISPAPSLRRARCWC